MEVKYKSEPARVLDIKRDKYGIAWAWLEFYGCVYRSIPIDAEGFRARDRRMLMAEDVKRHLELITGYEAAGVKT